MKKQILLPLFLILALCLIIGACKKEPETVIVKQERGYVCENYSCTFVETGAKYLTLLDCKSECADTRPGTIELSANYSLQSFSSYTVSIALGYTADDIAISAYFDSKTENGYTSISETKTLLLKNQVLAPGNYYYRVQVLKSSSAGVLRTGVFTIKPAETTAIGIDL